MTPLTTGDYPQHMRSLVGQQLPKFSEEQARLLRGSFDFIGLNYYTSRYAANVPNLNKTIPCYLTDSLANVTGKHIIYSSLNSHLTLTYIYIYVEFDNGVSYIFCDGS